MFVGHETRKRKVKGMKRPYGILGGNRNNRKGAVREETKRYVRERYYKQQERGTKNTEKWYKEIFM